MLEHRLINAFVKFLARVGAGWLVRDLIHAIDQNGNPKHWTPQEVARAIEFLEHAVESFGKDEATKVINELIRKFSITADDIRRVNASLPASDEPTGIQGLQ